MRLWPRRSVVNGLLAFALLAEFVVLAGHPLFGWGPRSRHLIPTPPPVAAAPSASQILLVLSRAAAAQPAPAAASRAPYAYVESAQWRLPAADTPAARRDAPARAVSQVSWVRRTGSGGAVVEAGDATADGATGRLLTGLADGPAAFAQALGDPPGGRLPAPAGVFAALTRLAAIEPIPGRVEAAALRLLAQLPGVVYRGAVVDRRGRPGLAVSIDADAGGMRDTLIFDPATGRLLESERALAGDPGNRDVAAGSVLAYAIFQAAGYARTPMLTAAP